MKITHIMSRVKYILHSTFFIGYAELKVLHLYYCSLSMASKRSILST